MFSPLYVVTFIRDLLRTMFTEYGATYTWDVDPRKSNITIGTVNDVNSNERIQQMPRILVQRGELLIADQFISNSAETTKDGGVPEGGSETFRKDVNGSINLVIESVNEGSCEEVADYVRRFIGWSKPFIETRFGFQAFGKQFHISTCDLDHEDKEKFKISINIPYIVEDRWQKTGNLIKLNHIFNNLVTQ